MIKPKVAFSYNLDVGGESAKSLQDILVNLEAKLSPIDYRKIVPKTATNEDILKGGDELLAVFEHAKLTAAIYLNDMDALVIPGNGAMVDPRLYFEQTDFSLNTDTERAIAELALLYVAIVKGLPILAVCGGHHILNVLLGGKLKNLTDDELVEHGHLSYDIISFNPKSEIAQIFFGKQDSTILHPFFGAHQQAISTLGGANLINNNENFLNPVAHVTTHKTLNEASENNYGAPIYSLQFHPEVGAVGMYSIAQQKKAYQAQEEVAQQTNLRIIKAFVEAAKTHVAKRNIHTYIRVLPKASSASALAAPVASSTSLPTKKHRTKNRTEHSYLHFFSDLSVRDLSAQRKSVVCGNRRN